jgi:hypothetical protein
MILDPILSNLFLQPLPINRFQRLYDILEKQVVR